MKGVVFNFLNELVEEKYTRAYRNPRCRSASNTGEYMAPAFATNYPIFSKDQTSLKAFLLTVDRVIHVEVRKLSPEAHLPEFEYADEADDELTMYYQSRRKLCHLAEGLIAGCAKYFATKLGFDSRYRALNWGARRDPVERCHVRARSTAPGR